jgi:alpha-1,3-rhamnosyl/mannosyltransferase
LDVLQQKVDLTIFSNFFSLPSAHSDLRATIIHDLTYLHYPETVDEKNLAFLRRVVPVSVKSSDFIIVPSEATKNDIVSHFQVKPASLLVLPAPPDTIYFQTTYSQETIDSLRHRIPTESYIYFQGNFEPRKNLAQLLEAYLLLPSEVRQTFSLVLSGSKGWKNQSTQSLLAQAQKEGHNIVHLGYVSQEEATYLMHKASTFVIPSLFEGFGMQLLEAFAAKTPVIASDIPPFREIGKDAALYCNKSPENLADLLLELLTTGSDCQSRVTKGYCYARAVSWDDNAVKLIAYTQKMLLAKNPA